MIDKVQKYIKENQLIEPSEKVLMAVSGGRDSITMASVLLKLGYSVAISHCNFQLRAEDSNKDEAFVKEWAANNNIPCFTIRFDTNTYASDHKISTQMAARELRYNWFEEISEKNNYPKIAIAHNLDDVTETFFINLIRGTGLDGLTGIKAKANKIIRPLLSISRSEIDKYIQKEQITYKEDITNASVKYLRNKIRHHILPEFKNISEHFNQTLIENISHLNESKYIIDNEINHLRKQLFIYQGKDIHISIKALLKLSCLSSYLYELLKPYNFSRSVVNNIVNCLNTESGKQFYSNTHLIVKDRQNLILVPIKNIEQSIEDILITKETLFIKEPLTLSFNLSSNKTINSSSMIASLDYDKLNYPLTLRKWKDGDSFVPLGMIHQQKVSDFLINKKASIIEKSKTYVLTSNNNIIWLVGHRIDDRFKISDQTQQVLKIEIKKYHE